MDTEDKLLSCAHCSGQYVDTTKPHYVSEPKHEIIGEKHVIWCHGCGVMTQPFDTEEKAIECWNRRAGQTFTIDMATADENEFPIPACPYCHAKPGRMICVGGIVPPNVVTRIIFCANPKCCAIFSVQIVGGGQPQQPRIATAGQMPPAFPRRS